MVKKDFTEYDRDGKDLVKKPLFKGYDKNIFPPESDIKKSEDQEPSVFNATPKLSMRKKALLFPEEEKLLKEISDIHGEDGEEVANIVSDFYTGSRENMSKGKNKQVLQWTFDFLDGRKGEISKYLRDKIGEFFVSTASVKCNPKAGAWEDKPKGWTEKSLKSLWNSLGGSVTSCMKKMEGKVKDAGAYCASLERKVEGSTERNIKVGDTKETNRLFKCDGCGNKFTMDELTWIAPEIDPEGSLLTSEETVCPHCGSKNFNLTEEYLTDKISKKIKIKVGDKILTSTKKKARVVKRGVDLCFWVSVDGNEIGSDFMDDVTPFESEEGLVKEIPLEEKMGIDNNE